MQIAISKCSDSCTRFSNLRNITDWFTKYITLTQFYLFYPNYDQLLVYYWLFIHRFPRYNTMILYFSHNEDIFDGSSENLESRAAFLGLHQPKIKYLWLKQQQQFDHFLKLPRILSRQSTGQLINLLDEPRYHQVVHVLS